MKHIDDKTKLPTSDNLYNDKGITCQELIDYINKHQLNDKIITVPCEGCGDINATMLSFNKDELFIGYF